MPIVERTARLPTTATTDGNLIDYQCETMPAPCAPGQNGCDGPDVYTGRVVPLPQVVDCAGQCRAATRRRSHTPRPIHVQLLVQYSPDVELRSLTRRDCASGHAEGP